MKAFELQTRLIKVPVKSLRSLHIFQKVGVITADMLKAKAAIPSLKYSPKQKGGT